MFEKLYTHPYYPKIIIFLIAFLLYTNTIQNDYALDDSIVITENEYVQQGVKGIKAIFTNDTFTGFFKEKKDLVSGGRYRPLSLVSFAIEEGIGIGTPANRHLINALLYGLLCLILFSFLGKLLVYIRKNTLAMPVAFTSSLIFAFHPIHTEVVANIKGRDELLAALFAIACLSYILNFLKSENFHHLISASLFFFLALLSKENAIAILPLVLLLPFISGKYKAAEILYPLAVFSFTALIYLFLRHRYSGGFEAGISSELMNNPFLLAGNKRLPTVFYTLGIYLKLLIIPHPLTFDYYPYHVELQTWSNPLVVLSLLSHIILLLLAIINLRRKQFLAFGILFYLICLFPVSNLLVSVGTFMNERFLFLPSVGFAMVSGYTMVLFFNSRKTPKSIPKLQVVFLIVLLLFGLKTLNRNKVWANNETLFLTDIKTSANSAKGNCMAGGSLYEIALKMEDDSARQSCLNESIQYLERAIEIYPNYIDALLLLGNAVHVRNGDCEKSLEYYSLVFELRPNYTLAYNNLNAILNKCDDVALRVKGYKTILHYQMKNFEANYQLGLSYGKLLHDLNKAKYYLLIAQEVNPQNKTVNRDLGVVYAMSGEYSKSIEYFEKVLKIDPDDPDNYINLGMSYQNIGRREKAAAMFTKAESLKAK